MEASRAPWERDQKQGDGADRAEEQRDEAQRDDEQRDEETRDEETRDEETRDEETRDEAQRDEEQRDGDEREDRAEGEDEEGGKAEDEDEDESKPDEKKTKEEKEEEEEESKPFISFKELNWGEPVGMLAALALAGSLFLPWFSTSADNPNSRIVSAAIGPGETATAWETFPILKWALLAACTAPFILAWIVARGHKLGWKPGEVTMLAGMTAFVLILCNGIILGKPKSNETAAIEVSLQIGYLVGLLAAAGVLAAGFLRQSLADQSRKPPGEL
jgi:hypothetical protein